VGDCDAAFGVYFFGESCGWVSGCSCEGDDCDDAYDSELSCELAHRGCLSGCAPQDAAMVGGCEPAPLYVFNGTQCVAMSGCACVGEDCGALYPFESEADGMPACEEAHAVCADRELGCEEIEAVYDDYIGHTACTDDYDCTIINGNCGISLGGCYHAVNRYWGEEGLSDLSRSWADADCQGAVCACPVPPDAAICDEGVCVPAP
jgi:hypothetical protein